MSPVSPQPRPRLSSLKGERAFRQVAAGEASRTPFFTLRRLPYKPRYGEPWQPHAVVGLVVSKKTLRRAVDRNRARRRVREALRGLELPPCRAMLLLNASVLEVGFSELRQALERCFFKPLTLGGKGGKGGGAPKGKPGDRRPHGGVA